MGFIHRFGTGLNTHVHFQVCVIDGVFETVVGDANADLAIPPNGISYPVNGYDDADVVQLQANNCD